MKGNEKIIITDNDISLFYPTDVRSNPVNGHVVMHGGEYELMKKLADLTTQNGGDILELGFGMHISADYVQLNPNVTSHTIIEIHHEIFEIALEWAKDKPNTEIILGDWFDVIPTLNKKFDGVLHDTFDDKHWNKYLETISQVCKKNTILTFYFYPHHDQSFNGVRVPLDPANVATLPYRESGGFKFNQPELVYTTFDGENFYQEKKTSRLL